MANPITQLRTAVMTTALTVSGIKWAEPLQGQEPAECLSLAAQRLTAGVFVRVVGGQKDQDSGKVRDDIDALVHVAAAVGSLRSREAAIEAVEALEYSIYAGLSQNRCGLSWMFGGLQFREFEVVLQTPQGGCVSTIFAARFDLREWSV